VSGSAPLAPELNRFFYSIGLTILEGYGLTETSPVTNVNTEDHFRIGTVGKPIPGTEIRIAEDGEILVRGPQVMKGYWNRPQDTAEAIDADGWFHTGDIGELDDDGFLRITDRKKDLIVTAGGKNVAPQPIENRLKTNPFVEQAVLVGDRRKFISVLVVPAFTRLEAWARDQGITWSDRRDLLAQPAVRRHMEAQVKRELRAFASFETPKRVALLEEEFTIGNGALTPTLKIKRKVVQERFGDLIEELYGGRAYGSGRR
jgi:long-chain acyl-CoA synthetase